MNPNRQKVGEFHLAFKTETEAELACKPGLPPMTTEDRADLQVLAKKLAEQAHHAHWLAKEVAAGEDGERRKVPFLRAQLMIEELGEFIEALACNDIVEAAHELSDVEYVVQGTVLALGLDHVFERCVGEVHRANMSKLQHGKGVTNTAGRVQKGPDFRPACVRDIVLPRRKAS